MPLLEPAEKREKPPEALAVDPVLQELWQALLQIRQEAPGAVTEAIPWITLKHPLHPVQRQLLREGTSAQSPQRRRFVRCLLGVFLLTFRLIRIRAGCRSVLKRARRQLFHVAAKSWVFQTDPSVAEDFYYGDLAVRLAGRGVKMLLLVSDPRGWNRPVKTVLTADGCGLIPELALVPLLAPIQTAFQQKKSSKSLSLWASSLPDGILKRAALLASSEVLSPGVTAKALYPWAGKEAARAWNLRAFISLYEGHGWEKSLLQGAVQGNPGCRTIGYQHTILMPYQLELLRPLPPSLPSRPQTVLCLGERSCELLRESHPSSRLVAFGSFRDVTQGGTAAPEPGRKTVLVLPEGFQDEAIRLFDCAIEAAASLPDHRFVLRCHPVLPFEEIRKDLARDPASQPNIEISSGRPIEEDFARSSVLLYRGSSSVLYGVLRGLKPFYLEGGRNIDPLFEVGEWRGKLHSSQELVQALKAYAVSSEQERLASWKGAADYVRRYTGPVREEGIEGLCRTV